METDVPDTKAEYDKLDILRTAIPPHDYLNVRIVETNFKIDKGMKFKGTDLGGSDGTVCLATDQFSPSSRTTLHNTRKVVLDFAKGRSSERQALKAMLVHVYGSGIQRLMKANEAAKNKGVNVSCRIDASASTTNATSIDATNPKTPPSTSTPAAPAKPENQPAKAAPAPTLEGSKRQNADTEVAGTNPNMDAPANTSHVTAATPQSRPTGEHDAKDQASTSPTMPMSDERTTSTTAAGPVAPTTSNK